MLLPPPPPPPTLPPSTRVDEVPPHHRLLLLRTIIVVEEDCATQMARAAYEPTRVEKSHRQGTLQHQPKKSRRGPSGRSGVRVYGSATPPARRTPRRLSEEWRLSKPCEGWPLCRRPIRRAAPATAAAETGAAPLQTHQRQPLLLLMMMKQLPPVAGAFPLASAAPPRQPQLVISAFAVAVVADLRWLRYRSPAVVVIDYFLTVNKWILRRRLGPRRESLQTPKVDERRQAQQRLLNACVSTSIR